MVCKCMPIRSLRPCQGVVPVVIHTWLWVDTVGWGSSAAPECSMFHNCSQLHSGSCLWLAWFPMASANILSNIIILNLHFNTSFSILVGRDEEILVTFTIDRQNITLSTNLSFLQSMFHSHRSAHLLQSLFLGGRHEQTNHGGHQRERNPCDQYINI